MGSDSAPIEPIDPGGGFLPFWGSQSPPEPPPAVPPPQVSQWYELVVFTASMEIYGCAVADKLDNNRSILNRRYYRQVGGATGGGA